MNENCDCAFEFISFYAVFVSHDRSSKQNKSFLVTTSEATT